MNKMRKNNLIILAVALVILLMMKRKSSLPMEETKSDEEIIKSVEQNETESKKKEPYLFDWKKEGDRDNVVGLIQKRMYMILKMLHSKYNFSNPPNDWVKRIYDLYKGDFNKFKIDNIYGSKTAQLSFLITGNKGTSLAVIRKKYLEIKELIY